MRKITILLHLSILCLGFLSFKSRAQSVSVNVVIQPPYSLNIDDYLLFNNQAVVTLTNTGNSNIEVNLTASISGDNGVSASIKKSYKQVNPIALTPRETRVLLGSDLHNLFSNISDSDINYVGISKRALIATNKLPEGNYQICIKAYDNQTSALLSGSGSTCANIFLSEYDAPIINHPTNATIVKPNVPQNLNISWTPSGSAQFTKYKVEIIDLSFNNQINANDAFNNIGSILFFKKDEIITNNLIIDGSMPQLIKGNSYALRVTAYDDTDQISFKNNGKSQVISFDYKALAQVVQGQIVGNNIILSDAPDSPGGLGPQNNTEYSTGATNIHEAYKGSDGGIYYVNSTKGEGGKIEVNWFAEHPTKDYSHIFKGQVIDNELKGWFIDVPKYGSEKSGTVTMEIKDKGKRLVVMNKHQGFLPNELTSINVEDYISYFPPAENNAAYFSTDTANNFTGFYLGNDGGRYHVREVNNSLIIYGESIFEKGTKPKLSKAFIGEFTGKYDGSGANKTKMYYGSTHYFNKGQTKYELGVSSKYKKASANGPPSGKSIGFQDIYGDVTHLVRKYPAAKGLDIEPKAVPKDPIDHKPIAEKSAAFVLFHFNDGEFATLFQNIGTDLNLALDNYDYKVVMKTDYLGFNADKEVNDISKTSFFKELKKLAKDGYYIDLFVFTHGARDGIPLYDKDVGKSKIKPGDIVSELGGEYGMGDFPLRMVYQMNCYGSAFIDAFLEVGAKTVTGAARVNYLPTQYNKFGELWQAGSSFESSINTASNYWYANSLGATGININLKWKIGNPLSWECKSCPVGTSITDKNDCLACYYKSFWNWEWNEYDYNKTGLGNLYDSSRQIVKGDGNITINTVPTW